MTHHPIVVKGANKARFGPVMGATVIVIDDGREKYQAGPDRCFFEDNRVIDPFARFHRPCLAAKGCFVPALLEQVIQRF